MDRRDIGTALAAALPILAAIVVERIVGPPMDEFLRWPWAPLVLLGLSLAIAAIYLRVSGRVFGPTAVEYQEALDKVLDYIYVLPPAPKPPPPAPVTPERAGDNPRAHTTRATPSPGAPNAPEPVDSQQ